MVDQAAQDSVEVGAGFGLQEELDAEAALELRQGRRKPVEACRRGTGATVIITRDPRVTLDDHRAAHHRHVVDSNPPDAPVRRPGRNPVFPEIGLLRVPKLAQVDHACLMRTQFKPRHAKMTPLAHTLKPMRAGLSLMLVKKEVEPEALYVAASPQALHRVGVFVSKVARRAKAAFARSPEAGEPASLNIPGRRRTQGFPPTTECP